MAGWASPGCSRLNPMAAPLLLTVTHRRFLVHRSLSAPPCVAALVCTVARLTQREGLSNPGADGPAPSCLWFPMASSKWTSHIADKKKTRGPSFLRRPVPRCGKTSHLASVSVQMSVSPAWSLPARRSPWSPGPAVLLPWGGGLFLERLFAGPGVEGSGPPGHEHPSWSHPSSTMWKPSPLRESLPRPRRAHRQLRQWTGGLTTCPAARPRPFADSSAAVHWCSDRDIFEPGCGLRAAD